MKKIIVCLLSVCLLAMCFSVTGCKKRENILKIYNWEEYMDESILEDFEKYYFEQTGEKITVQYDTFESNETMYTEIKTNKSDYDVICPSDYMIEKLISQNLLQELNWDNIPLASNMDENIRYSDVENKIGRAFDPENKYYAGYFWGTLGILYNKKHFIDAGAEMDGDVPVAVKSWDCLFDATYSSAPYKGILMKDSYKDVYAVCSIMANEETLASLKDTDFAGYRTALKNTFKVPTLEEISEIEEMLKSKASVFKEYESDSGKHTMVDGNATLNLAWSGDAAWAAGENSNLDYYVPDIGSNIWFDGWVIPVYAVNKTAAEMFINFTLREDIALRNMEEVGYTSFVTKAFSEDIKNNHIQNPSKDVINRCEAMVDFGEMDEEMVDMWIRIKV